MPLPKKKKCGISYLVQPILTQQLGVFSAQKIDSHTLLHCVQQIPYLSYCINLNAENSVENAQKLPNYELLLNKNYDELFQKFSKNAQRNIAKTQTMGIRVSAELQAHEFLNFYHAGKEHYSESYNAVISQLIYTGLERKEISLWGAYNSDNELIAALCLLHSRNRLIYLLPISNHEGKKHMAMFAVVNEIIHRYAGSALTLDFEGSRIETIARFYRSFGAQEKTYFQIRRLRPKTLFG
jgi:hypothetical protein